MDLKPPELIYLEGETRCPYNWATGDVTGTFLGALRDHGKILGAVCEGCGGVAVPPLSYCEKCGSRMSEWREVGPAGLVMSWARVSEGYEHAPLEPPFRFVLVRLAGADTELLHVAPDDQAIKVGAKVRPEFKPEDERTGAITDIRWFVPDASDLRPSKNRPDPKK
ncbi:MAG: Zn-ribbon domain-containing OB-fold protein [Candidatus Geothermincolia bacterium]